MFATKYYGNELLKLILNTLEENINYFVNASNPSFGIIKKNGQVRYSSVKRLADAASKVNFIAFSKNTAINSTERVNVTSVKVLDDGNVELKFNLSHDSKIIYFKLFESNRLSRMKIVQEFICKNKGKFKKGLNTLVINKESLDEVEHALGKSLEHNTFYAIMMASSLDGVRWGTASDKRFYYQNRVNQKHLPVVLKFHFADNILFFSSSMQLMSIPFYHFKRRTYGYFKAPIWAGKGSPNRIFLDNFFLRRICTTN